VTSAEETTITIPLLDFTREVAAAAGEAAARTVIAEHVLACPIKEVAARVDGLRLRGAALVGYMVGSGLLGAGIAKLLIS
jgi:hypothetical protein